MAASIVGGLLDSGHPTQLISAADPFPESLQRLRELDACKVAEEPLVAPRPQIDLSDVDASALRLDFYPSLNSPYTAIVYDRTIALKDACGIEFHHKPVLPMVMRGVPAPRPKATLRSPSQRS